jgi:erythronate-4-phosphate dehydrogenase
MGKATLNIVADGHVWGAEHAFRALYGHDVNLRILPASALDAAAVRDADILLVRSSTRVDAALLAGSRVRFVATATIGDDHVDKGWLSRQGIAFASAAGSSTGSVLEYMVALFLHLHHQGLLPLPGTTLGVIGAGRIGREVVRLAEALGMRVLVNDPPRARQEGAAGFVDLDTLLHEADLLTLHTPLIRQGEDATLHLLDRERLARFHGRGIINAARGACVDNRALADWLDGDDSRFAALDCWEGEPAVSARLLSHPQLVVATPHIAGHSLDGKAANTEAVYRALCRFLRIEPAWAATDDLPACQLVHAVNCNHDIWQGLYAAAMSMYPLVNDHAAFVSWLMMADPAGEFVRFRRNYPVRRAWSRQQVRFVDAPTGIVPLAQQLGMCVAGGDQS